MRKNKYKKLLLVSVGILLILLSFKTAMFLIAKPKAKVDYAAEYNRISLPQNYDPNKNAADYYQKAYDAFVETPYELRILRQSWPEDFNSTKQKLLTEWLSSNSQAFEYFQKASEMPYYWIERYSKESNSMLDIAFSELAFLHRVGDAILWDAKFKASDGQFQAAFENILAFYRAGKHKCQPNLSLVEQYNGLNIKTKSIDSFLVILNNTNVDSENLKTFQDRFQVEFKGETYIPSIRTEKLFLNDVLQHLFIDNSKGTGRLAWRTGWFTNFCSRLDKSPFEEKYEEIKKRLYYCLLGPNMNEVKRLIEQYIAVSDQIMVETPWKVKNNSRDYFKEIQNIKNSNIILKMFGTSPESTFNLYHKTQAQAKALITILAILRFQADTGHYPESLEELVSSGYLRELPDDPYSDKPLIYNLKEDGFTLYSVGKDFIDNGGLAGETYIEKSYIGEYHEFARQKPSPDIIYWPVQQN